MVTGFAAGGLVDLVPALAVMLGANVGTTLIVQVLSFNVAEVAPALILIGLLMFRRASTGPRDFGRVLIGLGLVLMALHQFVDLLTPYEDVPSLRMFLGAVSTQPVLDVILAAGLTWAAHSSVAIVLLIMSFATKGTVPPEAAFALVLGANLGTAINPVLEGATGDDPAAKRLPLGNLLNRLLGVGIALAALPYIGPWLVTIDLGQFAGGRRLPHGVQPDPGAPLLSPADTLCEPAEALAAGPYRRGATPAGRCIWTPWRRKFRHRSWRRRARSASPGRRAGDHAARRSRRVRKPDRRQISETKRLDDVLDKLNTAIKSYLTSLDPEAMSDADHRRVTEILAFATNMEQAGDIVDKNLLGLATKKLKRGLAFSEERGRRSC